MRVRGINGNGKNTIYIFFNFKKERGRERECDRNIDLSLHLFMHLLADSCMCPDWGSNKILKKEKNS